MLLEFGTSVLTGSVSLASDAAESAVNLVAGLVAFVALSIAAQPAHETYRDGYEKDECFSRRRGRADPGAAITIIYTTVKRFLNPAPLESLGRPK
jgi:divalent metal cation (Fe/Co/Zn/Cd) transporter